MARRSQCSSAGDNPLDPNYLPPHYREDYRLAIDALVEEDLEGYYKFLQKADVVDFLSTPEIQFIRTCVQVPRQSHCPEQQFLETSGDGSSDTYWPIHSDLDVPGLDLGWPQMHRFIGPTEVTTLVNPPEPDMPSIKEQARRLIKNAQQVIAIVMDMFTDVDIFADILNAAMRSVPVYILLDEQNADHFLNMVSNCRVNLQNIQFLRVRTVSGMRYHCRSGKSFKGQMMDRFLLTDCRAVLSGNYSFMWSFEKLHRCMAHLFLGQLVSTFDEEFRILFAQSEPLAIDNTPAPVEEFGLSQKTQYPSERISLYRESRKFLSLEGPPEERMKHSFDDRMDLDMRMMHLKRHEPLHGSGEIYSRFPSQQPHMDMSYDQGPYRTSALENPSFKRHSYAEGVQGRFSYPFLQPQGMPEPEIQGRPFHRGQQPYQGQEPDYNVYDKFWNPEYQLDQFSEPGLGQEMQPPDNFDPVLNYLSSTRNMDFDQSSEKILPEPDLPFSSPHPRRLNVGQPYACQTSPTPSSSTDHKSYLQDSNSDRKDPTVKRGLRNWRISSYLSTCDNPSEEGLPLSAGQAPEPFDEPSNPVQQTGPVKDLSYPKIPNVREEQQKKFSDDSSVVVTVEPKTTPSTSESSSTADVDKAEEAEQKDHKEPKLTTLRLEESFRRKYNAATPRSSRLRSSLIFSSLDQQNTQDDTSSQGQQDEEEQMKTPFVSQLLGQRRSGAREPFEWKTSKPDDEHNKGENEDSKTDKTDNKTLNEEEEPPLSTNASSPQSKPPETEASKFEQLVPAPTTPLTVPLFVDMNDPDERLMFFKQLAAQRKAAKAAEAEKNKGQAPVKTTDTKTDPALKEEPNPKESVESVPNTHQPTLPNTTPVDDPTPELGTKETEILSCDSTSEESSSYGPSSVEVPPSESTKLETVISEPKPLSDKLTGSEISSSNPTVQRSWDYTQDSNSDVLPTLSSDIREEKVEESVSPSPYESSQSQLKSSGNHLTVDSVHAESDISADVCRHTESDTTAPSEGSESVTPAISSMELSEPAEQSQTQNPEVSADSGENKPEAINKANNSVSTNQAGHLSAQHKQPKTSQSRYQSSTANVISSSNLRDDTKLLLEQISANNKADRNAKRESERGTGTLSKEPHKSAQDKERLLERIQSMRKERKVYSRFQV
uniref:Scaffolding anchor of CK1 domain-containing protein n=1 Tax=Cynoglossus semilaevis TaxID=244447 RepID=A0A3P8WP11_CYNSE